MPLFFMLSGAVLALRPLGRFDAVVQSKIKRLIIPYFVYEMCIRDSCTSDLNAWVNVFKEFAEAMGMEVDMNKLFGTLYNKALELSLIHI